MSPWIKFISQKLSMLLIHIHNIIKQCAFVHVGPENITIGCPNVVQGDSNWVWICTRLGHPMVIFSRPTWTNAHYLIMWCSIMLPFEPRIFNKFWAHTRISFRHMSSWSILRCIHNHTLLKYRCPVKISNHIRSGDLMACCWWGMISPFNIDKLDYQSGGPLE